MRTLIESRFADARCAVRMLWTRRRLIAGRMPHLLACLFCFWLGTLFTSFSRENGLKAASQTEEREHHFLVVLVLSAPDHQERRRAVRETWLRSPRSDVKAWFVVGSAGLRESTLEALRAEEAAHDDVMMLPMVDAYAGLTDKVLRALVRVDDEWDFNYLLKVDDDTFVNLPAVLEDLDNANYRSGLYWGFFDGRAPVFKSGQWAEPDYVLCDRYVPYALGGGYVLSANLVNYLARNAPDLHLFSSEDVSVGTWLAPLRNVHRVHDVRFDTEYLSRGCSNKYIVTHKQSVEDMADKHRNLVQR